MADKAGQMVLSALSLAAADAVGLPLHATKSIPGLFPSTAVGKQAAQRCQEEGLLKPLSSLMRQFHASEPTRTKAPIETFGITEKGYAYLFSQVSPRPVLEDLLRALERRQGEVAQMTAAVQQMALALDAMQHSTAQVLEQIPRSTPLSPPAAMSPPCPNIEPNRSPPMPSSDGAVVAVLERWHATGVSEDCPLPELFRQIGASIPGMTIGSFHDELRRRHEAGQIYLHPWTGPLYELPEPAYALLVGHLVAYYASLKNSPMGS